MIRVKLMIRLILASIIVIAGCGKEEKREVKTDTKSVAKELSAQQLFDTKCGICHWQQMPEKPVAPPVFNVKRRYLMQYPSEQEFTDAVVNWVENPEHEKALLRGAVERFNVMPKLGYTAKEVRKIANYIYRTDFPMPKGMKHHNEHGRGGMGRMGKQLK